MIFIQFSKSKYGGLDGVSECTNNDRTLQSQTQVLFILLLTLHNGHQSSADPRYHITWQPLFNSVDPHPANDGHKRERCILGAFWITAGFNRNKKLLDWILDFPLTQCHQTVYHIHLFCKRFQIKSTSYWLKSKTMIQISKELGFTYIRYCFTWSQVVLRTL